MLTVGNVYGHGFDVAEVHRLERVGFSLRPEIGHYAGSQILRFIDFERGPPLEFVELGNAKEYEAFVPKGMSPYSPGVNLLLPPGSPGAITHFREEFTNLRPYSHHVNYDGSSDPGKPGWAYLNFEVPVLPGIFLWLTHREEPQPVTERSAKHANGATGVRGLLLDVEAKELTMLAHLVGGNVTRGILEVGGLSFWTRGSVTDAPAIRGKRFPLAAVVVEANGLDTQLAERQGARQVSFLGQPAAQVSTNPLSWDLLLTMS